MQGVTELSEVLRCQDEWLHEVQQEVRHGCLSQDNYNFLHGKPTDVPGSWVNGDVLCGNAACRKLAKQQEASENPRSLRPGEFVSETTRSLRPKPSKHVSKRAAKPDQDIIMTKECKTCSAERKSKQLVATNPDDERFRQDKFLAAPAVYPNNDIKYDVNKQRAQTYAAAHGEAITWVSAKDTVAQDALRAKPGLAAQKLEWLKKHDRDCGDLYGMLPLVHGMPMALTDHIDRSNDKKLLRGKVGYVHSWVLHNDEDQNSTFEGNYRILKKPPVVVFLKFPGATWKLDGLDEEGLYPIRPWTRSWFVDKGRKHPVLRVRRQQLPLAPAFAMTAHASQGHNLPASIVDLQIGHGTSPIASYVAFTRVERRQDMIIYRPFDHSLFTNGSPEGLELLLKTLRGEEIDWAAIEENTHRNASAPVAAWSD